MNLEWRKKPRSSIHPLVTLSARLSHYRGLSQGQKWEGRGREIKGMRNGVGGAGARVGRGQGRPGWAVGAAGPEGRASGLSRDSLIYPQRRAWLRDSQGTDGQGGGSVGGPLRKH